MPKLDLTDTEFRIVLAGLAELPMKIAFPVARKLELQSVEVPETKDKESE